MRDFALALVADGVTRAEGTATARATVRGIAATEGAAQFSAEAAAYALDFYSRKIGLYPYTELFVVPFDQTGGMEYPGLVMISSRYLRSNNRAEMGELVIAHEVAHQWFYALVGSDQIKAPWLDESLVEFWLSAVMRKGTASRRRKSFGTSALRSMAQHNARRGWTIRFMHSGAENTS